MREEHHAPTPQSPMPTPWFVGPCAPHAKDDDTKLLGNTMSMDLSVWSSKPFELPSQLPQPSSWQHYPKEWCFAGNGWHILVMSAEDRPPSAVLQKLPDAAHVAYVTLEPIGADRVAYDLLEEVVRAVSRATDGVWVDLNGSAHLHSEGNLPNP